MAPVRLITNRQLKVLVEFAEAHRDIALNNTNGPIEHEEANKAWSELAKRLNSLGEGTTKTPEKWKRYWHLLKCRTRRKAADNRRYQSAVAESHELVPLTDLEERIASVIGKIRVRGRTLQTTGVRIPSGRVSFEQRTKMLEFMLAHEDLARGKVPGPDAARTKKVLLRELSVTLNELGYGASKAPDKWMKCWQDWKSDTKAKVTRIKKYRDGTGGPIPAPLSYLEEKLMQFWGVEVVQGLEVVDPLEFKAIPVGPLPKEEPKDELLEEVASVPTSAFSSEPPDSQEEPAPRSYTAPGSTRRNEARDDPLLATLQRQAAAIEHLGVGMREMAANVASATAALLAIAAAIDRQPRIRFDNH